MREADYDTGTYRVYFPEDDVVSFPLPHVAFSTLKAKPHLPIAVGTRVACLIDECFINGCVIGAIYTDQEQPQQGKSGEEFSVLFDNGGSLAWDGEGFTIKVNEVVLSLYPEGVRIAKAGDDLQSILSELMTAISVMTHTSAAAGSPTSPPLNVSTFTALRQRVQNLLN